MGYDENVEIEAFLPKYNEMSTGTSSSLARTKVKFISDLTFSGKTNTKESVFFFDRNFSVREAAEHAIANYPEQGKEPDFSKYHVLFSENLPVPDLNVNVHSLFATEDTMIIGDEPDICEKTVKNKRKYVIGLTLLSFIVYVVFFFFFGFFLSMAADLGKAAAKSS